MHCDLKCTLGLILPNANGEVQAYKEKAAASLPTSVPMNQFVRDRTNCPTSCIPFSILKKKKLVKLSSMMIQCINAKLSEQKMLELCLLKNKIAITKTGPFRFYNVFIVITLLSLTPCALHQIPCQPVLLTPAEMH